MKANEAPEKIYLQQYDENTLICLNKWNVSFEWSNKPCNEKVATNIEYVRTDAFIDKACEWLSDTLQTVVDVNIPSSHHVESIPALGVITQTEFIEKFKKEIIFLLD